MKTGLLLALAALASGCVYPRERRAALLHSQCAPSNQAPNRLGEPLLCLR